MSALQKNKFNWWKHGVFYHIYPRSFYDSNDDGIGDLQGIIQKLDYLSELGIQAIWLSPIYESPQVDFGYDVSDYRKIDATFGNFDDFKELLRSAHRKGIKVIMDMILNHTSDKHPWFLESKSSLDNPKRDWYIWKKGVGKKLPNNWKTAFVKNAWKYDATTKEYYYHSFFKEQPDLNWRNSQLKEAMFNEIRFWLDLGVDGFRLDVINYIAKDKKFRNNPWFIGQLLFSRTVYTRNRPKSIKIIKELRTLIDEYPDKMYVGEIYTLPPGNPQLSARYLGNGKNALHLAFDFSLLFSSWNAAKYGKKLSEMYAHIPKKAWPCHVLSNHDIARYSSKAFLKKNRMAKAKLRAVLMLTLRGTPFIYYGEEIGMENVYVSRKNLQDSLGKIYWPFYKGRDKARTPMQWDTTKYGGFSSSKPWLPVSRNDKVFNVKNQLDKSHSILNVYQDLIALRLKNKSLYKGSWTLLDAKNKNILAYKRAVKSQEICIYLNFSSRKQKIGGVPEGTVLYTTHRQNLIVNNTLILNAYEAVLIQPIISS